MDARLQRAVAAAIGAEVRSSRSVGGGSINEAAVVETSDGPYFVKWNQRAPADMFDREAEGLEAMRNSGTSLVIPRVVASCRASSETPAFLVLENLASGRRVDTFDEDLGRGLAELHRATADAFGFPHNNYCGATPQPNPWNADWGEFYTYHRIGHLLDLAGWNADRDWQRFLDALPGIVGTDPEPPALIHGDLWSGNLHVAADGRPALIDPAAYYGHREAELGMMKLFEGFGTRVWDAYDEAWPLQPGWRDRLPAYELYHVLNHYVLFGGSYGAQARAIRDRLL